MLDLISDWLEGERLAGGSAALQRKAADLNVWLLGGVEVQFAGCDITLTLDAAVPTRALGRTRLQWLARNLWGYARCHGARRWRCTPGWPKPGCGCGCATNPVWRRPGCCT